MELNSLLNESVSAHKSMQADAARLADKWSATRSRRTTCL
jgi:hypothetical protein